MTKRIHDSENSGRKFLPAVGYNFCSTPQASDFRRQRTLHRNNGAEREGLPPQSRCRPQASGWVFGELFFCRALLASLGCPW